MANAGLDIDTGFGQLLRRMTTHSVTLVTLSHAHRRIPGRATRPARSAKCSTLYVVAMDSAVTPHAD